MADMFLYILCEGELDEMFYERIAERVTGKTFESPADLRLRPGSNWKTAIAGAKMLLARVRHWQGAHEVGAIIAVDNDRAPNHPGGSVFPRHLPARDQHKQPRYTALVNLVHDALGYDRRAWPVKVALAVPVEMIESWVLALLNPRQASALPIFSQASSASAWAYHGSNPPPQLKDLVEHEAMQANLGKLELFWEAAESDLAAASSESPSLRMFLDELNAWQYSAEA